MAMNRRVYSQSPKANLQLGPHRSVKPLTCSRKLQSTGARNWRPVGMCAVNRSSSEMRGDALDSKPIDTVISDQVELPMASKSDAMVVEPAQSDTATHNEGMQEEASQAAQASSHPLADDVFGTQELVEELQDRQQFGKRGEAWLFAQTAALLLILVPPMSLKGLIDLLGTLLITAGLVFIAYGLFTLGRNFSPLPTPRKVHKLVTTGMYGYVRHPMYSGLIMASFGLAALTRSEFRFAMSALLWWILEQKVNFEEAILAATFPEYGEYKLKVPKFFPFIY